jgi:hypothetical protein
MDLKEPARRYFEAFSKKDIDAVAKMFDEKVILKDWEISATGKTDVVAANKKIFDSVDTISVVPIHIYQENRHIVAELDILVNDTERLSVVDVITFTHDRFIGSIRAYKG